MRPGAVTGASDRAEVTKVAPVADADLAFCMMTHHDYPDLKECLSGLRRHYPRARIIVISDGDRSPRLPRLAGKYSAEFLLGKRLFLAQYGGQVLQRMFDTFLTGDGAWLVKIDPDTRAHRRLDFILAGRVIFGTLQYDGGEGASARFPIVQGGFVAYPRSVCREIRDSKLLLGAELLNHRETYASSTHVIQRVEVKGLVSTDYITRYICLRLKIPVASFSEVYSTCGGRIRNPDCKFAFTHPHKSLSVVLARQLRNPRLMFYRVFQLLRRHWRRFQAPRPRPSLTGAPASKRDSVQVVWPPDRVRRA